MENANITMLKSLNVNSTGCTLKVKILRLWKRKMDESKKGNWNSKMKQDKNKHYSIEMILMDEECTKITAQCLHRFFDKVENHLIENDCLFIINPKLGRYMDKLKLVENEHKVTFAYNTSIRKTDSWAGPQNVFLFSDFKSILGTSTNPEDNKAIGAVLDVVGYVLICYEIEDTQTIYGPGKRLNLKLINLDDEVITATLWDEYALEMHAYMSRKERDVHVFLLIQFAAVKLHKEARTVSNAFQATRLFINTDIDDIQSFKKRYLEKVSTSGSSSSGQHQSGSMMASVEDLFLKGKDFSPIAFVTLIKKEQLVVILGTIVGICTKQVWYYDGCNVCKCKVEKQLITIEKADESCDVSDKKVFKCTNENCNKQEIHPIYRFKIPIIVQDDTGSVTLTLFNREAVRLLSKSADDVFRRQEKPDDSNSIGGSMNEVQSINACGLKETLSSTGENVTPLSKPDKVGAISTSGDLKRNLEHVYDVDDASASSATKARTDDKECDTTGTTSQKLLVPKKEK